MLLVAVVDQGIQHTGLHFLVDEELQLIQAVHIAAEEGVHHNAAAAVGEGVHHNAAVVEEGEDHHTLHPCAAEVAAAEPVAAGGDVAVP